MSTKSADPTDWQLSAQVAAGRAFDRIATGMRVALGFHSVTDGFLRLRAGAIEQWLGSIYGLERIVAERVEQQEMPPEIRTPADLLVGLIHVVRRGESGQLMIRDPDVFEWAVTTIGFEHLRLGGTSGNMANALAPLGLGEVLVYANPLSGTLGQLFDPNPNLYTFWSDRGTVRHGHPWEATGDADAKAIHWVLEFPADLQVQVGGNTYAAPRAGRFYPCYNPVNNRLQIDQGFATAFLERATEYSHFIASGFHLLSETYSDGRHGVDLLRGPIEFLERARHRNGRLRVHLELAFVRSASLRLSIFDDVTRVVDSVGMNDVELALLLDATGAPALARLIRERSDPLALVEGMRVLAGRVGLSRVHVHALGYYLALTHGDPDVERDALAAASQAAAYRAQHGRLSGPDVVASSGQWPLSSLGLEAMSRLGHTFGVDLVHQTPTVDGYHLVGVPTQVVENPVMTVGLGDTISAVAFLAGVSSHAAA